MVKPDLKKIVPLGFLLPFLLIIIFELVLSYGLDFYNRRLNDQIGNLELKLKEKENQLSGNLESNDAYIVFSQLVNIVEFVKNRQSLIYVINKFNEIMPKFLIVRSFGYDDDRKEITIEASLTSWEDYARFNYYLNSLDLVEVRSFTSPIFEKDLINFSLVLYLKPGFFKQ